ncbi:MAG: 2-succinyl-5-enolpyruvyl-6-hydroxy-3-cyclohexene-1-carboxylic-acid synthase [bacterium]
MSNRAWGEAIIESLCRLGANRFFLSPGARSAPLAAALATRDVTTHYDERGMAFAALGWAMSTGRPAVCVTTSGSAVANLLPACVEAFHSNVPLVLLTADRPPELRGTGANQTIQQPGIFGGFVRQAVDLPCAGDAAALEHLSLDISKALEIATGDHPGPVHLNVPIREPLLERDIGNVPQEHIARPTRKSEDFEWPQGFDFGRFVSGRGIVVVGRLPAREQEHVGVIKKLAARLGWPLVADAASGARLMPGIIRHVDWILQRQDTPVPDRMMHFGGALVSKRLAKWLAACRGDDCLQVRMFPERLDPWEQKPVVIRVGIDKFCRALVGASLPTVASSWIDSWRVADDAVGASLDLILSRSAALDEPSILRSVARAAAATSSPLFLGNSMPIRDFDSSVDAISNLVVKVFANRGASGIDGNIATVAGVAMGSGSPVLAVMGDLAALHDLNSLPLLQGLPVTLIVINNGGGGIFRFLPIEVEERLLETPHAWNFEGAAAQFGIPYFRVASRMDFEHLLSVNFPGPRILECRTDRAANHALHLKIAESCRALPLSWTT